MILCCSKCKKELTTDLYPLPKKEDPYDRIYVFETNYMRYDVESITFKENVFLYSSKTTQTYTDKDDGYYAVFHNPAVYFVSSESVIDGVIPKFTYGSGCCNYCGGHELKCSCSNIIGKMYLDCYEDQRIEFLANKVDRKYKSYCKSS